jgi:hypothetical protein
VADGEEVKSWGCLKRKGLVGKMSRSSEVVFWVLISKWKRRDQKE